MWWLDDNPSLSKKAKEIIADGGNLIFVSAATIWEIGIKHALGKLKIPANFRKVLEQQAFEMLPITADHAYLIGELPAHHRDTVLAFGASLGILRIIKIRSIEC